MLNIFSCLLLIIAVVSARAENASYKTLEVHGHGDDQIPLANLEGEPSALIASHVNAITGDFCDFQVDLVSAGTHPLIVQRSFNGSTRRSGNLCNGWNLNHSTRITSKRKESPNGTLKKINLYLEEGLGTKIRFVIPVEPPPKKQNFGFISRKIAHAKPLIEHIDMEENALDYGATNTSSGYISGKTNLKNLKLTKVNDLYELRTGSGLVKKFNSDRYIETESRPDGQKLKYSYDKGCIIKCSKVEHKNVYGVRRNRLEFIPVDKKELKKRPYQDIFTWGSARRVRYHFSPDGDYLLKVEKSDAPTETYRYTLKDKGKLISKKELPEMRHLALNYYVSGDQTVCGQLVKAHKSIINKVKELSAPAGYDDKLVVTNSFIYLKGMDQTDVYDAYGNKTSYKYDTHDRLTDIIKHDSTNREFSKESLYWSSNKSSNKTNLMARTLDSKSSRTHFAKTYSYDSSGNVLENCLYGNLTGENKVRPVIKEGKIWEIGCECYKKRYSYIALNLLESEVDDKHAILYTYHPGTSLLASKLKGFKNRYYNREFYEYDGDAALMKLIVDDGSKASKDDLTGVTERHIIYSSNTCNFPFGLPETVDEKYLDLETHQEVLVHRVVNKYTDSGKITSQQHYDNQGVLAYTLFWDYDSMDNIIKEVDALGRAIIRRYDANCNCIFEQGPREDCHKEFVYDFMNRLVKEEEFHDDGTRFAISHRYNYKGNRIATTDVNGHTTDYEYDPFGRIIKTTYPEVCDEHGILYRPFTRKNYDAMGCVISETDAKGNEKKASYTVRSQLVHMTYPDGTCEKNIYHINGQLKEAYAKNGSYTQYTYDIAGRPISTKTYSAQGELLKSESSTYSGFHLLEEIDPMGVPTHYTYYGNGKLKSRQKGDNLTSYEYDSLGRLFKTIDQCDDEDAVINIRLYDLLNRVIEERVEDCKGTVLTSVSTQYDISGNISSKEVVRDGERSVTTTLYDSHETPIIATDALGNKTITHCDYNYRNDHGQLVPHIEITDPLGNITAITQDTLGRTACQLRKNAFGEETQKINNFYDGNNNLCRIVDTVFSKEQKSLTTVMAYNSANQLIDTHEAVGLPEQKHTSITYNSIGLKEDLIKADGVHITHTYDALGRLQKMSSSDGSVLYTYTYDLNGNAIFVEDHISKTKTCRSFNENGNLSQEILANGYSLNYLYDNIGRSKQITFPDNTKVSYTYKSCFMESVKRLDSESNILYEHVYDSYNLAGSVTHAHLIGKAGTLSYTYDLAGRPLLVENEQWSESLDRYDQVGNLLSRTLKEGSNDLPYTYEYEDLYQLKSESGSSQHCYTYDSHYNRTSKDQQEYALNGLNQILHDGTTRYTYDPNGNLISEESSEKRIIYTYDALDRLITYDNGTQSARYHYDENNRRIQKDIDDRNLFYLYQGQNEIGTIEHGKIIELRLLGNSKGAEIGASVAIEVNDNVYAPIHDQSGNIACLIDSKTGNVVETYRYSAYGEELFSNPISPWRFASKRTDNESGLVYFGRRYYHSELGRWIAPDPIGREGGPNLYGYVLNNPLTHFDAYGLFEDSFFTTIIDLIVSMVCTPIAKTGECLEALTFHLMPFPIIRDGLFWTAQCMQGKDPLSYEWESGKQHACCFHYQGINGPAPEGTLITTFNGICTTEQEMKDRCAYISEKYNGLDVYGIYNPTHGVVLDLCEVVLQKFGIPTNAQRSAQKHMEGLIDRFYNPDNGLTVITHAHSQGCETVHNLSSNVKKMMEAYAYGPAHILQSKEYKKAENYLSPIDLVPYIADPTGLIRGMCDGNVTFVKPAGNPFLNHCMSEAPYREILIYTGMKFSFDYKLKK